MGKTGKKFEELVRVIEKLRAPNGCPWDRKQSHKTLKPYMLEELYEALEAIDSKQPHKLAEELGDMLLHIIMHATFAKQDGTFTIDEVVDHIKDKMIRRHPHVFGNKKARNIKEIWSRWEKIKKQEKAEAKTEAQGILDGVPNALPALLRAEKTQKRAARVGFDWKKSDGAWKKLKEEIKELEHLLKNKKASKRRTKIKEELGDILFAVVNVARKLDIDAEDTMQKATNKFKRRFSHVEKELQKKKLSLKQMDQLWNQAKQQERP